MRALARISPDRLSASLMEAAGSKGLMTHPYKSFGFETQEKATRGENGTTS